MGWRTYLIRGSAAVLGGAMLLLALLLFTPPGVALAGRLVAPLSGGAVRITALSGNWIGNVTASRVEVADDQSTWLRADQVALRWSPLALLRNRVSVHALSADRITVLRRPLPSGDSEGETPRITVTRLALPHIQLAAPVVGTAVRLAASGALDYASLSDLGADLLVTRAGSADRYRLAGHIQDGVALGEAVIREGADGILGRLTGMPGLGPVNLTARADGDRNANTLSLDLSAGALRAQGRGTVRMAAESAALDFSVTAPAMTPSPDLRWESLSGQVRFRGRFDAPDLAAHLILTGSHLAGIGAKNLTLDLTGGTGNLRLTGTADGLVIPGQYPDLFAASPLQLEAQADLQAAARPVTFQLVHPLATLRGSAQTRGETGLSADLTVPALAPFAALENVDMRGNATLHVTARQQGAKLAVTADGRMHTQGAALPARLLGGDASLTLTAELDGSDLTASRIQLKGAAIAADIEGSLRRSVLDYRLALDLNDVSRLAAPLRGTLELRGTVTGPMGQAALSASGAAALATKGFSRQRIVLEMQADGLPGLRDGRLRAEGQLNGAPLLVRASLQGEKTRQASVTARWKSLRARAEIAIGAALAGKVNLALGQIADIAPFTGVTAAGAADVAITLTPRGGKTDAVLNVEGSGLTLDTLAAQTIALNGTISDVLGKSAVKLDLAARGMAAQGFRGDARATLEGPASGLALTAHADMTDASGAPLKADARALLDLAQSRLTVNSLAADWRGVPLALQAPATLSYANGLAVDRLDARLGKGTLTAGGSLLPKLSATAAARNLALEDFRALMPELGARGTLSGSADLSGTLAAPEGRITLEGRNLRTAFSSRAMPAAELDARLQLAGGQAAVTATLTAGDKANLSITGSAPLSSQGQLDLHAGGKADLALLDPLLAADGRRARGQLAFAADIAGVLSQPRITGNGTLANGEFQDHARGLRVTDIAAAIRADGTRVILTSLTSRAGPGTLAGSGSITLTDPSLPVEMTLEASNARPIVSDLITATLSGNLKLTGAFRTMTALSGRVQLTGGEINLPDNFPPEVAVLNVRRRGQAAPPPPAPQGRMTLDLDVQTQGPIFVRGHGVDAEMGGGLRITGLSNAPVIGGGLKMVRGSYSVGGQRLDFTTGNVRFDGMGLRGRIDPTLDFVAQTVSGGVTATLTISGYASAPKITLSSSPSLPQDEVVAHLLFQQSVKQLTPLQLAGIAQAAAAMGGIGGGFNPLGTVRRTLGLDRLSVGSANGGANGSESQTTVEAGRYVTRNVYVGVKQNLSGGTQTQVQLDITRRLKAQATVSADTTTTAQGSKGLQDSGSSIGLSYQFDY